MTEEEKKAIILAAETFYKYGNVALDHLTENAPLEHIDALKHQLVEFY